MNEHPSPSPVLSCRTLGKTFVEGGQTLEVLREVEFEVMKGDLVAIVGASGSGKTTLLQLLGGLDRPTQGSVSVMGEDLAGLDAAGRGRLRNRHMGFVYQFHHLLPEFSALENVAMPLLVRRERPDVAADKAAALLERVGLGERLDHRPAQLSGGERQRAAVARALITRPALVLADEPTANLDSKTSDELMALFTELNEHHHTTFVIATHDQRVMGYAKRLVRMLDGRIVDDIEQDAA